MQKININNYEAYAIDYINGDLSADMVALFEAFIEDNPEINEEIQMLIEFEGDESFDSEDFAEEFKAELNALTIDDDNFEELCIAYTENDLDNIQAEAVETFAGNSKHNIQILETYRALRLDDSPLLFPDKKMLKHSATSHRRIIWYQSAAAVALFSMIIFTPKWGRHNELNQLSRHIELTPKQEIQTEKAAIITCIQPTDDLATNINKAPKVQPIVKTTSKEPLTAKVEVETTRRDDTEINLLVPISASIAQNTPSMALAMQPKNNYQPTTEEKYSYHFAMATVYSPDFEDEKRTNPKTDKPSNMRKVIAGSIRLFEVLAETDLSKKEEPKIVIETESFKKHIRDKINRTLETEESYAMKPYENK